MILNSKYSSHVRARLLLSRGPIKSFSKNILLDQFKNISLPFILVSLVTVCCALFINKVVILFLPIQYLIKKITLYGRKREEVVRFERDYPTFLISLSSSLRCGLDPLTALLQTKELFEHGTPIAEAIEGFHRSISAGIAENQAIKSFGAEISHPDIVLFQDAFILARHQGASLSFCLQRIARTVRARQSFRRKAKTAVAMQKLSAVGILISVLAMFAVQITTSHETLVKAWEDPVGFRLLMLAFLLVSIGIIGVVKISYWELQS